MKKGAFTLSEVLITLGIIGVVAAMTLPALINKINMQQYIARLKADYSILSQAHTAIAAEYGSFLAGIQGCTDASAEKRNICFRNLFAKKIKSAHICKEDYENQNSDESCFTDFSKIKYLNGNTATRDYLNKDSAIMMVVNGTSLLFYLDSASCSYNYNGYLNHERCGWITVDVNGPSNPNTFGKDIYVFYVFDNAVKPLAYEYLHERLQNGDCTPESNGFSCSSHYILK